MSNNNYPPQNYQQPQQVYVQVPEKKSNGMGIAGFVLSLVAIFLSWIPALNWILWLLGLVFSAIGMFRQPKGLPIAGLVISLLGLVVIFVVISVFFDALESAGSILDLM